MSAAGGLIGLTGAEVKPPVWVWLAVKQNAAHHVIRYSHERTRTEGNAYTEGLWHEVFALAGGVDNDEVLRCECVTVPAAVPLLMSAIGNPFPAWQTLSVQVEKTLGWKADILVIVQNVFRREIPRKRRLQNGHNISIFKPSVTRRDYPQPVQPQHVTPDTGK